MQRVQAKLKILSLGNWWTVVFHWNKKAKNSNCGIEVGKDDIKGYLVQNESAVLRNTTQ